MESTCKTTCKKCPEYQPRTEAFGFCAEHSVMVKPISILYKHKETGALFTCKQDVYDWISDRHGVTGYEADYIINEDFERETKK
jgi:hypothetical protein